jgi:hypothetical protein
MDNNEAQITELAPRMDDLHADAAIKSDGRKFYIVCYHGPTSLDKYAAVLTMPDVSDQTPAQIAGNVVRAFGRIVERKEQAIKEKSDVHDS